MLGGFGWKALRKRGWRRAVGRDVPDVDVGGVREVCRSWSRAWRREKADLEEGLEILRGRAGR